MVPLKIKLPENFLEQEVRCGYTITKQIKEVWAIELDLLSLLQDICDKNEIKYFADSGTMLGAIRHKGFIPWDDDIDISMMREDFDKFCKIAKKQLKYPYFFQDEDTEPGSLRGHAKLMRLDTTAILKSELDRKLNFSQGIFIDVFCFDNLPDDLHERENYLNTLWELRDKSKQLNRITYRYYFKNDKSNKSINLIKNVIKVVLRELFKLFRIKNWYWKKIVKLAKKYKNENCKCIRKLTYKGRNEGIYLTKNFSSTLDVPYEFLSIKVPIEYDSILTQQYGSYMEFKTNLSAHGDIIFDTNISFNEYMKNHSGENK